MTSTKDAIRQQMRSQLASLPDRESRSTAIWERIRGLPEWESAAMRLLYVHVRNEVCTREALAQELAAETTGSADRRRIAVPYCEEEQLRLIAIGNLEELAPGKFGILEPRQALRADPQRIVAPADVDVALLPGVAFDSQGNRLGNGHGYYDRLLPAFRPNCLRVALAFECQVLPAVPCEPHDVPVQVIVTESRLRDLRECNGC